MFYAPGTWRLVDGANRLPLRYHEDSRLLLPWRLSRAAPSASPEAGLLTVPDVGASISQHLHAKGDTMDSDTLQIAGRLTAMMVPQLELDQDGETAAEQVAALYWTVVSEIVGQRKPGDRAEVPDLKGLQD